MKPGDIFTVRLMTKPKGFMRIAHIDLYTWCARHAIPVMAKDRSLKTMIFMLPTEFYEMTQRLDSSGLCDDDFNGVEPWKPQLMALVERANSYRRFRIPLQQHERMLLKIYLNVSCKS